MFYKNILKVLVLSLPIFSVVHENNVLATETSINTKSTSNSIITGNNMIVNGCDLSKIPSKELIERTLKVLENNRLKLLNVSVDEDYAICYENLKSFINNIKDLQNISNKNNIKQCVDILFRCEALCMNMNEIVQKSKNDNLKDTMINIHSNCIGVLNYYMAPFIKLLEANKK